jgi:hypothetical protein
MRLELVTTALRAAGVAATAQSGVYVWATSDAAAATVLYIGEATNLAVRLANEEAYTRNFLRLREEGHHLWDAAGCGLEAVLARHPGRRALTWPFPPDQRRHVQTALIRLAALAGATPPAQGAGWDYGKGKSHSDVQASALLQTWFADPAVVAEAERDHGASAHGDGDGRL